MSELQSEQAMRTPERGRTLNCDQVALLTHAFERYLPPDGFPAVSYQRQMKIYALLYEVMDLAGLKFEDEMAKSNGTPHFLLGPSDGFNKT